MSEYKPVSELPVDRREETVVTHQPGYAVTEQVIHDVAAERRLVFFQVIRIIWTILGVLEIFMGLRFLLKLIGANPNSGFAVFIYGITGPFLAPFTGLTATPSSGGSIFEFTTLIGMGIYVLFCWIIIRVMQVAAERPSARTVMRSIHEQTPGAAGAAGTSAPSTSASSPPPNPNASTTEHTIHTVSTH